MHQDREEQPAVPRRDPNDSMEQDQATWESLAVYDEELRGRSSGQAKHNFSQHGEARDSGGAHGGELTEVAPELRSCLELLERAWPRHGDPEYSGIPRQIGRFQVERVLGSGGFAIVYLARDPRLGRLVALKVPRLHSLVDHGLRERFRREARAVALLDHPHIVPLYEAGEDGPACYIATAYCPGPTLAQWLKQQATPVPARLAASLVACLAEAVHYSHSHGVLHRDLKPGNVILVPRADVEEAAVAEELPFLPRLTDFGLAKIYEEQLDDVTLSATLGTPAYMAPEQAAGGRRAIGPTADVYALGVILYELLVGRPPFMGDGFAAVLSQVRSDDPVPPRQLRRETPRDLETICLKCLEKSPLQRYSTAQLLEEDLRRFLRGRPLRAKPPGSLVAAAKWIRRNPVTATLLITLFLAAIFIPALLVVHNQRLSRLAEQLRTSLDTANQLRLRGDQLRNSAEHSARVAESRRQEAEEATIEAQAQQRFAERVAYASCVRLAELAWREADIRQCRLMLAAAQRRRGEEPPGAEWSYLDQLTSAESRELGEAKSQSFCVAVSPDGRVVASGGDGGWIQIIDVASGTTQRTINTDHDDVRRLVFSRSGDRLAVCGEQNTVTVWSVASGQCQQKSPEAPGGISSLAWLLDDTWIAYGGEFAGVRLWRVADPRDAGELSTGGENVASLVATTDGRRLYGGGRDSTIWCWDVAARTETDHICVDTKKVSALAVSRSGSLLAAGFNNRRVVLFRQLEGKHQTLGELNLTDDVRSVDFSPEEDTLAILEQFGTLRLVSLEQITTAAEPVQPRFRRGWLAHEQRGNQLAFVPGSSQLVSVGRGTLRPRLWNLHNGPTVRSLEVPSPARISRAWPVTFAADGESLLTTSPHLQRWSTATLEPLGDFTGDGVVRDFLAVSRDGRWLAVATEVAKFVELWELAAASPQAPVWKKSPCDVECLAFSPCGDYLAGSSWMDDEVHVLDRRTGETIRSLPAPQCHSVAYSPDGRYLAADQLDDVVIWDTTSWQIAAQLRGHLSTIFSVAFSDDGRWLASAGHDREIRLWDTANWAVVHTMVAHRADVTQLQFTPDGRTLLALDAQSCIKIWDLETGLALGNLHTAAEGEAASFALSPDGRQLAIRLRNDRVLLQPLHTKKVSGTNGT